MDRLDSSRPPLLLAVSTAHVLLELLPNGPARPIAKDRFCSTSGRIVTPDPGSIQCRYYRRCSGGRRCDPFGRPLIHHR